MFISHKYKAIFVHIQRTGGTSLERFFSEVDPELVKRFVNSSGQPSLKHCFASAIKAGISDDEFRNYTKFCVVRNPFDRMVSWYFMLKHNTTDDIDPSGEFPDLKAISERVSAAINQYAENFEDFVMIPRDHHSGLFERFYVNQLDYIAEGETILVDRILRFESLSEDFGTLAREIGFEGELPHFNKSKRETNYRDYYNDVTRERIYERFKRDIAYFGYDF